MRNILENTNLQLLYFTFSLVLNTSLLQRNRHSESIAKILFRAVSAKSESGKKKKKSFQRNFASFIFLLHLHQQSARGNSSALSVSFDFKKNNNRITITVKRFFVKRSACVPNKFSLGCSNLFHIKNSSKDFSISFCKRTIEVCVLVLSYPPSLVLGGIALLVAANIEVNCCLFVWIH